MTIRKVTAIDGAILIDAAGVCYGIGVILDGLASEKGSSARGARYNSAIRYVEQKTNTLAVVVSADGSVDLIPTLRPQIDKNDLAQRLKQLEELAKKPEVNGKRYHELMEWFTEHKFYLSQGMCTDINRLRKDIDATLIRQDSGAPQIVYRDFQPDPEMNDSYFLTSRTTPLQQT